jgi:hypothetical protein
LGCTAENYDNRQCLERSPDGADHNHDDSSRCCFG